MSIFNLKTSDVIEKYGIKRTTLFYWRDNGKIEFIKDNNTYFFKEADIIAKISPKVDSDPSGIYCHICGERTKYKHSSSFVQNHLLAVHNIDSKSYYDTYIGQDKDKYCQLCNTEKGYISLDKGYHNHCSDVSCRNSNPEISSKSIKTKKSKYGDKLQDIMSSISETKLERYGDGGFTNREKSLETIKSKYGVDNVMKVEDIKDECLKSKSIKKIEYYKSKISGVEILDLKEQILTVKCNTCGSVSNVGTKLVYTRLLQNITLCTTCFPICDIKITSYAEKEIANYIRSITTMGVKENVRDVISNELDIYIPEKKVAIEYNGLYWHSDQKKERNYHLNKTNECENIGIRLIHIFEDEWKLQKDLIKSKLRNIFGLTNNKIFARKCIIDHDVPVEQQIDFYNLNHIQGYVANKTSIGLRYNQELVALMSFKSDRDKDKYAHSLVRFATKSDSVVIGGASKIFSYFIKNNSGNIVSYADRCWSYGGLYDTLGFQLSHLSKPTYFYVDPKTLTRYHRFNYRKEKLKSMGFYVNGRTELDIINEETNLIRLYNSGHKVYIYKGKETCL